MTKDKLTQALALQRDIEKTEELLADFDDSSVHLVYGIAQESLDDVPGVREAVKACIAARLAKLKEEFEAL
jgi:hypothetical protein